MGTDRGARPDFEAYAAARRPDLVRLAVLLGHPAGHAAVLADRALVRAQRSWRRLREEHDPDAGLRDLLLEERRAALAAGEAWWRSPWAEEQPSLPASLRADLDGLPVDARARLAWAALGRSDDGLLGATAAGLVASTAAAVPGLPVPPPTGAEPARRRRRVLSVLAVVTLALLVGVAVTALLPDPAPPEPALGPVAVSPARNPAPVAWYADGRLHLAGGTADVDGVVALAELGTQVVYLDDRGDVVRLGPEGERVLLGRAEPSAGLAASGPAGRVAWVAEDGSTLEVADVPDAEVVARLETATDGGEVLPRLVRLAAPVLVFVDAAGEHEWHTGTGSVSTVVSEPEQGALVDVVGVTQLRQVGFESIAIRQLLGTPVVRLGDGGEVSPRQQFVWTRSGEDGSGVRVFAVGTGEELASGTERADVLLDARFTAPDRITYLLADRAALPGASEAGRVSSTGTLEVRTCQVRTGDCRVHAVGAGAGDSTALLAR
ncbi:hypothetical protein [uncultured Nocardioides sp.]|uniref:hypothetical protein n=1 Tax=uncultured Nocardioides sp. TaxID=198441 RepID=UPI0026070681|nr:hypothetical protein [uncultured Nocardioides sp.]